MQWQEENQVSYVTTKWSALPPENLWCEIEIYCYIKSRPCQSINSYMFVQFFDIKCLNPRIVFTYHEFNGYI